MPDLPLGKVDISNMPESNNVIDRRNPNAHEQKRLDLLKEKDTALWSYVNTNQSTTASPKEKQEASDRFNKSLAAYNSSLPPEDRTRESEAFAEYMRMLDNGFTAQEIKSTLAHDAGFNDMDKAVLSAKVEEASYKTNVEKFAKLVKKGTPWDMIPPEMVDDVKAKLEKRKKK